MRAINHALSGAVIGLIISEPLIALPLAFLSHFVLDAVPHYGQNLPKGREREALSNKLFIYSLFVDAVLCFILVLVIGVNRPTDWLLAIVCAFLAASPDFFSFNRFYKGIKGRPWRGNIYSKFAASIQWFERPSGALVETVWFVCMIILLTIFLKH